MIEIKNLTKIYVSKLKESVTALNNISLTLPSKGLVFLLGESGAGKSTMLNLLGGIERADGGEIYVDGLNIVESSDIDLDRYRNTDVGFIFQDFNLLSNFNVAENVRLAQDLQSKEECGSKVDDALTAVKMSEYANRKINELSGGQKQRIAIARAIVKKPKIVLADEPTGALDAKTGRTILELLKEISKDSLVLVVSHDEVFANSYADRIIRIEDGKVIEDKTMGERAEIIAQVSQVESLSNSKSKKKYSLSSKTVVKMAAYSLGSKKIRLAITLLLCIVCFAVFGVADTLASWNCENTTYDAIMTSSDKYLVNWASWGGQLNNNDFTKLYGDSGFTLSISEYYLPIKAEKKSYGCYNRYADGFAEIDDKTMQELDATLYAGRYPQEQGEIAISYHIYRGFKAGAYKTNEVYLDGSMIEPTDKENGILGKCVTIMGFKFTIVGIIDTGYDYEKNAKIDPLSDNFEKNINDSDDITYNGHSILFLSKGGIEYINSLMQTSEYPYGAPSYSGYSFENEILNELAASGRIYYTSDLETFQKSNTKILWLEEKNTLADNEAIISYNHIDTLLGSITYIPGMSGSIGQGINLTYVKLTSNKLAVTTEKFTKIDYKFFKAYTNAEIYKYAIQNATLYQDDENVKKIVDKYADSNLEMAVAYFISSIGISSDIQTGYLNNPYGKSGLEIIAETNVGLLNQYNIANQFDEITIRLSNGKGQLDAKIVGVYIPSEATGISIQERYGSYLIEEKSRALINPTAYQIDKANLESKHLEASAELIRIAPENQQRIKNGISQYIAHNNENWSLFTNSKVLQQASYMKGTMDILKKIFYYVSLGIGIFAAIMLGNYLINSIMARKKEIGILRAIGATSRDIFHICLFEGMILFVIIFSVATILSGVAGAVINSMIKSDLDIMFPISVFGIRQVALIFAVSLAVTLVVSLIGSYVVSKRKPIDVIR